MDGSCRIRRTLALVASLVGLSACNAPAPLESVPSPRETLRDAGRRLSNNWSANELTRVALEGDRVLALLNRQERDALARGYMRFRIDQPAVITVAALGNPPFWLAEQGFRPTGTTLAAGGRTWSLHEKHAAVGWVGLGVNSLDRRSEAHYAVFLRTPSGEALSPLELEGEGWTLLAAQAGVSLERSIDRPIEGLPPSLQHATLIQPDHNARHSTALAQGRVWKTHVVAGDKPDQLVISLGHDAAHTLTWTWRTRVDASTSVVRFRKITDPKNVREAKGESHLVEVPELLNDPIVRRHVVRAEDLEPDTTYAFSLGNGTEKGMSPWLTVSTGPEPGSDTHLLYLGDPQCGLEGWGKLMATAHKRHPEIDAILIAGDLVDRGNERSNWDHFFLRARDVFDRVPLMPAIGNHEYLDRGPFLYRSFFDLPANGPKGIDPGLVYAFEIGDVFIAVLDSTLGVSSSSNAQLQASWLDEQLARTPRRWKLVMFHHPLYASHPKRESPQLRDAWVPVLDRHHVDLVLQGHDHAYLRTYPLRAHRRVEGHGGGTTYVTTVSGDKYYDQDPRDYTEVGFTNTSTYQTIDLLENGLRLSYRAWNLEGRELDRLELRKPERVDRFVNRTSGALERRVR